MDESKQHRRGNTRQRIQDVALELFTEHGYEKTSLREIAEHLDVTKAALYYHFKTKEDILISIFEDVGRPITDLIEWGRQQPHTLETKLELLRRYDDALATAAPMFRFMQENQATVKELLPGEMFKQRMFALYDLMKEPNADLTDQVRCISAIFTMHAGTHVLRETEGAPEDKRRAVLQVALDMVTQAHAGATARAHDGEAAAQVLAGEALQAQDDASAQARGGAMAAAHESAVAGTHDGGR